MNKKIILFLAVVLIFCIRTGSFAEQTGSSGCFDWENYTYEELIDIKADFDRVFEAKQREWAVSHGDREIKLDAVNLTLYSSQNQTVTPQVTRLTDDAPASTTFVWTSSDDSVARVSAYGTVTAVSDGDAEITCAARDNENIFASVKVHVIQPVTEVRMAEPKISLLISDDPASGTARLSAEVFPENAYCKDLSWTSNNENVAVVDENGNVSAVGPGTAVITVFSKDEFSAAFPKRAVANVTVLQAVSSVGLDQSGLVMEKGTYAALKPTVLPENASLRTVSWETSNPEVVRVTNGQLYAAGTGTARITASASDGSGKNAFCDVTVIQKVTALRINEYSMSFTLDVGKKEQLSVTVMPADATVQDVEWSSSDESVAAVNSEGEVLAKGTGPAVITCTSTDGSGKSASVSVFVPSIGFESDTVVVTSRDGMSFDVKYYGSDPGNFSYNCPSSYNFNLTEKWIPESKVFRFDVEPLKAGSTTVTFRDAEDTRSQKTLKITIDQDASYDTVSYPVGNYYQVLDHPKDYKGQKMSISGKVWQIIPEGKNEVSLRVGTYTYHSDVFYVTYNKNDVDFEIKYGDIITVYGTCTGTETYTSILERSITVPSITADKIMMGYH